MLVPYNLRVVVRDGARSVSRVYNRVLQHHRSLGPVLTVEHQPRSNLVQAYLVAHGHDIEPVPLRCLIIRVLKDVHVGLPDVVEVGVQVASHSQRDENVMLVGGKEETELERSEIDDCSRTAVDDLCGTAITEDDSDIMDNDVVRLPEIEVVVLLSDDDRYVSMIIALEYCLT